MRITESLELALKNIASSKTRTLLTMLGIIIGVAAVIVGLGNGLEGYVTDSFSDLGTNTLTVTVSSRGATRTLDVDDMYEIVEENSQYLDLCSPTASMMGQVKIGSDTVSRTTVTGVSEDYLAIKGYAVAQGRGLQYSDILTRSRVCVIGAYLNQAYYGGNAVGQPLLVLTTTRRLQLRVDVPQRYVGQLAALRTARFLTPYDDRIYALDSLGGRLVSRGRATGGSPYVPVTFEFDNRGSLVPGTAVEVWLLGAERQGVVSVPRTALTEEQGLYYVYIKEGKDVYRKQEVTPGASDGSRTAILHGLHGGEQVVVAGVYQVKLAALSGVVPEGHSHEH